MMTKKIISVEDLTYIYPTKNEPSIRNINLDIFLGDFLLIVGPTGSGKSTLGMCLNGLIPHVLQGNLKGRVLINGVDTREKTVAKLSTQVGLLFQDPDAQIFNLYGFDELAFGCENLGLPPEEIQRRISWIAKDLGLTDYLATPVQELSLGLKQRIALASILAMEPKILVLDEPTSNLDAYSVRSLVTMLKTLQNRYNITIIVIEHDTDSFADAANRIAVIDNGCVVLQGTPNEVYLEKMCYLQALGIKVPDLFCLINEIQRMHAGKPYDGNMSVDGVSDYIVSSCQIARCICPENKKENKLKLQREHAPILTVENLSIQSEDKHVLLQDINASFFPGETVAVIGANGAGKTMLFKTIAGLRIPTTGSIKLCGIDLLSMGPIEKARQIGFVFQEPDHQFIKEKVGEDMILACSDFSSSHEEAVRHAKEILTNIGLIDYIESYIYKLSMGQRRMLSIATALKPGKRMIILDEPTIGLDFKAMQKIIEMLKWIKNDSLSTIIITHDLNFARLLCNRVIALVGGGIIYDGPISQLIEQEQLINYIKVLPPIPWLVYENLHLMRGMCLRPALTIPELMDQFE